MGEAGAGEQQADQAAESQQQAHSDTNESSRLRSQRSHVRGRDAQFGYEQSKYYLLDDGIRPFFFRKMRSATDEVARILACQRNYYSVLKVKKDTPANEVKMNYFKLSRLVHPDKCSHPQAKDASAAVNQAYDTLSTSVKKSLYDQYVDDAGDLDAPAGMSYADWEAQRAEVQIPKWMESILRIPGGAFCLLIILLPFTLVLLLLCLVVFLLCLPVRLVLTLCCGVKLHPPGQHPPGGDADEDADEEVVINMPPETATPGEGSKAGPPPKEAHVDEENTAASQQQGAYKPPPPV